MMESGDQCVTVAGMIRMQLLYACNWDFKEQVCVRMYNNYSVIPGWKYYYDAYCKDATAIPNSFFGDGAGPYHLSSLGCSGEERTLLDCSYTNQSIISTSRCRSGNDAGVRCDGKSYIQMHTFVQYCIMHALLSFSVQSWRSSFVWRLFKLWQHWCGRSMHQWEVGRYL